MTYILIGYTIINVVRIYKNIWVVYPSEMQIEGDIMKIYKIVKINTVDQDLKHLEGYLFEFIKEYTTKSGIHSVQLHTPDGDLWFADEEVELIK